MIRSNNIGNLGSTVLQLTEVRLFENTSKTSGRFNENQKKSKEK